MKFLTYLAIPIISFTMKKVMMLCNIRLLKWSWTFKEIRKKVTQGEIIKWAIMAYQPVSRLDHWSNWGNHAKQWEWRFSAKQCKGGINQIARILIEQVSRKMYQEIPECDDEVTYKDLADVYTSKWISTQNWTSILFARRLWNWHKKFSNDDISNTCDWSKVRCWSRAICQRRDVG